MNELSALRVHLDRTLRIGLAWLLVGSLSALFEHNVLHKAGLDSRLLDRIDENYLRSLLAGLLGGGTYIFLLRPWLRRLPFFHAWGIMATLILLLLALTSALWRAQHATDIVEAFLRELLSLDFLGTYLYWSLLMGATMLMVRMNDQYGSGGITYLTGRYHKPRQEMRIFMFLDMRSSTAIAEQLGHVKYFQLLNELFTDITDVIVRSRGEIYQYVGDEVSVSWTFRNGVRRERCVRCFLDIRSKLQRRARHYEARFGIVPVFKAGFHYGPVTTGEVGSVKRERIYSGDVVNTAARIQNSCNELGVDNLLSQELLEVLHLPSVYRTREMGSIALRGKAHSTTLWTIE
ncbi:MAG: adenylate/guanylate cyclase domain-containing protein [Flavobacteriales bacterium]